MAQLKSYKQNNSKKKVAYKKKYITIDLTPMVDLGFLLITFFVFTTTLCMPAVMNLNMPYDKVKPGDEICESCVLTILLSKNNIINYYEGLAGASKSIMETFFRKEGIRNIILQKRRAVQISTGSADNFVMIIKPTEESTFQNFVNIIDEVAINKVKHYYTSEADEKNF